MSFTIKNDLLENIVSKLLLNYFQFPKTSKLYKANEY